MKKNLINSYVMKYSNISAVFPAYNEEKNLEKLVTSADDALKKYFIIYEIIIVDDGSQDDSKNVLKNLQKKFSCLKIIKNERNLGYGSALKKGLCAAQNELIFFSDADNQFDICEIKKFIEEINNYDVVIGYRLKRNDSFVRKLYAQLFKGVVYFFFGLKYKDINCAFKIFRKEIIQKTNLY